MRRVSRKKRAEIDAASDDRETFAKEHPECMLCRRWCGYASQCGIHEIPRGAHRVRAYRDRRAWLRLCWPCHQIAGDYSRFPLTAQYRLKMLRDPRYYSRTWLNACRLTAKDAIDARQVRLADAILDKLFAEIRGDQK